MNTLNSNKIKSEKFKDRFLHNLKADKFLLFTLVVLVGILSRFLPHPPNFTPILAYSVFFGWKWKNRYYAFLAPLITMLISDSILGFHDVMWVVYISLFLITGLSWTLQNMKVFNGAIQGIVGLSLLSSVLFFLTTNAAAWWMDPIYSKDVSGLLNSYLAGVPFFHNTLFSTLLFLGLFHVLETLIKKFVSTGLANNYR